jgi:hypothetical protein
MDGSYALHGPGSESCSAPAQLPCYFELALVEEPSLDAEPRQRAGAAAAELNVLLAQKECSSQSEGACARLHARVAPWIERASERLERATSVLVEDEHRGLQLLGRAARALTVAKGLTGSSPQNSRACRKGLRLTIGAIRRAIETLRSDLGEQP